MFIQNSESDVYIQIHSVFFYHFLKSLTNIFFWHLLEVRRSMRLSVNEQAVTSLNQLYIF